MHVLRWAGSCPVPVLSTIAASETTQSSEVQLLIDQYGPRKTRIGDASVGYTEPVIQSLYTTLAAQGDTLLTGAFETSLTFKERDIDKPEKALAHTTRADIIQVRLNLFREPEKRVPPPDGPATEPAYSFFGDSCHTSDKKKRIVDSYHFFGSCAPVWHGDNPHLTGFKKINQ